MKKPGNTMGLKNIGKVSEYWLNSIGIRSADDLARVGSVEAYKRLKSMYPQVNILALYAMEAALWDLHWNDLPEHLKQSLHEQVGYEPKKRRG